jgi:serine/threonine protein kinase/class 3 adenylate cyclase/tetratricopeptide (TPR) repeat protein
MTPERWQQIERVFHAALDSDPDVRSSFLNEACAGDDALRSEVESLLASLKQSESVRTMLPAEVAAQMVAESEAETMAGRLLGHYQLLSLLGAGGMGQIYLGLDTRLGRKVALKLLSAHFTTDLDRVRRFEQEARAASALNHPNIITIHDMGQVGDVYFIATEFIEGATLRQMIGRVGTEIRSILDIAAQVANALAASHAVGIAHRDIKPENIMVRPDGYVKVLDFGLAKLSEKKAAVLGSDVSTRATSGTDPGTIMGTASYMSPEQARGLKVDERTDIFSLGIVIYEMVTGTTPFSGETVSDVIASLLTSEPPALASNSSQVSPELERIVLRALVKDRDKRYQTVNDLLLDLKGLAQELEFEAKLASPGKRRVATGDEMISSHSAKEARTAAGVGQGSFVLAARNRICAACGATNSDVAEFCSSCGGSVVRCCSKCKADLPLGARFCMSCGQQVGGVTADDRARHARVAAATPAPLADKMRSVTSPTGERRVVTVLFADLTGTASSGAQLDTEDWSAILNQALDRLIPVIYRYEGTIARLVGNSLLVFFGAPVAHEDDPERAARAAVDLLAAARAYAVEVQRNCAVFDLRVTLNTGSVIVGTVDSDLKYEHSVMGDTVSLAARLQYAAPGMTALVTEHTYGLISLVSECVDAGLIEVKGSTSPVRAYELRGLRAGPSRPRGLAGLESALVGRDVELSTLLQLSATVQAGLGRVAVIIGEPGLGKTRLITEWKAATAKLELAGSASLQWAEGHCLSYGQGHPYHLLVDLLRSLVGVSATADESETRIALLTQTDELFGDSAINVYPFLGHLLSLRLDAEALERVQQFDPKTLQNQYLTAVRSLLQALSARSPLVLILEDIHWADPSSTELLLKLLAVVAESRLLFCFVARPDIESHGWKLVISARDTIRARLTELPLNELSEADSRRLISNLVEIGSLPEQARTLILEKSEGNPFFVEEVIRMLIDSGAIIKSGEKWVGGREVGNVVIPGNLQGLLLERIDRLPNAMKLTLRTAAVIGRRFSVRVLERATESVKSRSGTASRSPLRTTLLSHLNILESSGLIRLVAAQPELEYLFRHALVQDAAYDSLLRQDRARLHFAVGEALEQLFPGHLDELAAMLAHHFDQAGIHDKAVHYFSLAGDRARTGYANAEAIAFYRAAINQVQQILSTSTEQVQSWCAKLAQLEESLADVLELAGQHDVAMDAYKEAINAMTRHGQHGPAEHARIYRKIGFVFTVSRRNAEANEAWDGAEALLGCPPVETTEEANIWWREWIEIQVERMWNHYWQAETEEMESLSRKVLPAMEQFGTPVQRTRVLGVLTLTHLRRDRYVVSDETIAVAQNGLGAALSAGSLPLIFDAHFHLGFVHLWRRELELAEEQLQAGKVLAERTGDAIRISRCVTYLMVLARMRGNIDEAKSYIPQVLNTAWAGQMLNYASVTKATLAWIAWREGNLVEARELGRTSLELMQGQGGHYPIEWLTLCPLVAVEVAERNIEQAIEYARALLNPKQMRLPGELTLVLDAAIAAGEQSDFDTAGAELERAVILAEGLGFL